MCSLGKTLLSFALLHSIFHGQICLLLQVFLDFILFLRLHHPFPLLEGPGSWAGSQRGCPGPEITPQALQGGRAGRRRRPEGLPRVPGHAPQFLHKCHFALVGTCQAITFSPPSGPAGPSKGLWCGQGHRPPEGRGGLDHTLFMSFVESSQCWAHSWACVLSRSVVSDSVRPCGL